MNVRTGTGLAVLAVVAAAAAAYFAGLNVGRTNLSDGQRKEIQELVAKQLDGASQTAITDAVSTYLAANPDVVGSASIDQTRFAARVREFLMTEPEVINDALAALEKKRAEKEAEARVAAVKVNHDTIFSSPRQVVLGNPQGDVTLVEFFDYNCTYCRRARTDMDRLLDQDPRLRVVLKEFPVLGPRSVEAAKVGIAVNLIAPDKYRAFHDKLLGSTDPVGQEEALAAAAGLGIDRQAIEAKLKDPEISATIEESYTLANALGLTGTPSYIVGNEVVIGAVGFDQLSSQITSVRDCGKVIC